MKKYNISGFGTVSRWNQEFEKELQTLEEEENKKLIYRYYTKIYALLDKNPQRATINRKKYLIIDQLKLNFQYHAFVQFLMLIEEVITMVSKWKENCNKFDENDAK